MNPRVRRAVEFMNSNLHRELTIEELCGIVRLKHSRLCELFHIEFGIAPLHYHKALRLKKARDRLETSLDKVEVIILELGYDRRRFFRDFKAHCEITPSQYRARHFEKKSCNNKAPQENGWKIRD